MPRSGLLAQLSYRATVVSPDRERVLSFDREGRWSTYFRSGVTFKRSLASEVHSRWRLEGVRRRGRLSTAETRSLFQEVHELSRELAESASGELLRRLRDEILGWEAERLVGEAERFREAYKPISILPPDQYRAIVLQATEGCSWNQCTFCNFYMNRPFEVKSPRRFEDHIRAVRKLLGKAERQRSGVFLADGNALAMSNRRLLPLLDLVDEKFPQSRLFGFVDLYSGERRSGKDWEILANRGLDRVYIGMETGLDDLLKFVNKPGSGKELVEFVATLKRAGSSVCLILMVGLGGRHFRTSHAEASLEVLSRMSLNEKDLVYLSPFVEHPTSEYRRKREEKGLDSMSEEETEEELQSLARRIRALGVPASRYEIREFLY